MAYSAPTTKTTGTLITSTIWNQDVVDNVLFLANPPACRVYNSISQNITDNTELALTFDSERFDTDNMHSTSSNTSRITFNTAGVYIVTFTCELPADTTYQRVYAHIKLNGATSLAVSDSYAMTSSGYGAAVFVNVTTIYKFAATNYVQALVFQDNSGGAAKSALASPNYSAEFAACWVGLG